MTILRTPIPPAPVSVASDLADRFAACIQYLQALTTPTSYPFSVSGVLILGMKEEDFENSDQVTFDFGSFQTGKAGARLVRQMYKQTLRNL